MTLLVNFNVPSLVDAAGMVLVRNPDTGKEIMFSPDWTLAQTKAHLIACGLVKP